MTLAAQTNDFILMTLSSYDGFANQTAAHAPTLNVIIKGPYSETNPDGLKDLPAKLAGVGVKTKSISGKDIKRQVEIDTTPKGGWLALTDQFPTGQNQFMAELTYNYKMIMEPAEWNTAIAEQNVGSGGGLNKGNIQLRDYIATIKDNAVKRLGKSLNTAIWNATPTALALNSIPTIIKDDPTTAPSQGLIGGIAAATAYWQNYANTTAVTFSTTTGAQGLCLGTDRMLADMDECNLNRAGSIELIVMPVAGFTLLRNTLIKTRTMVGGDLKMGGDIIIPYVMFNDTPVVPDPSCTASHIYYMDLDKFYLWYQHGRELGFKEKVPGINTLNQAMMIGMIGELGVENRRTQGVSTAVAFT